MSRDPAAFAAELRADARGLRQMADALERRATAHDHAAWVERIIRRAALGRPAIDEDLCAFGLRYIGSALAPVLDYT